MALHGALAGLALLLADGLSACTTVEGTNAMTDVGTFAHLLRHDSVHGAYWRTYDFDEPPAITFDQFRRWANQADRNRQQVEGVLGKLKRIFGK